MPTLPIVRLGHPVLREPAQPVPPELLAEPEIQQLIDDMVDTMRAAAGVGLAAPQVGIELQIFVYEAAARQEGDPEIPLHVVINPMLTPQAGEPVYDWEGCLSIPDLRGLVPRHPAVRVQALDRGGQAVDYLAVGFAARIVQHEFDHLHGIVFLDRMRDLKSLAFGDEWERYMVGDGADDGDDDFEEYDGEDEDSAEYEEGYEEEYEEDEEDAPESHLTAPRGPAGTDFL